jgi:hypothetical protein
MPTETSAALPIRATRPIAAPGRQEILICEPDECGERLSLPHNARQGPASGVYPWHLWCSMRRGNHQPWRPRYLLREARSTTAQVLRLGRSDSRHVELGGRGDDIETSVTRPPSWHNADSTVRAARALMTCCANAPRGSARGQTWQRLRRRVLAAAKPDPDFNAAPTADDPRGSP